MGRFSPTYTPEYQPRDHGSEVARAIGTYMAAQRQEKTDKQHDEELAYQRHRRETLDPLEEAFLRGQMREHGVVPSAGGEAPRAPGNRTQGDPGSHLAVGIDQQRGNQTQSGLGAQPATGLNAPGSFNPATGSFNAPGQGRVALGGGYDFDPSQTEHGRKDAQQQRIIEAMVGRGVPRQEAETEVLADLKEPMAEHFHPGPYHPRTMHEALDYEQTLIHARGIEEQKTASIREANERRRNPPKDLRWEERRRGWEKELGSPTNQLHQDLLDALADGDEPGEILDQLPRSQRTEGERYLRKAVRLRRRATSPTTP